MEDTNLKIEIPLKIIAKFWWAWFWRTVVFISLVGLAVTLIMLFFEQLFGLNQTETDVYSKAIIYLSSPIISMLCLREILKLQYENYEISFIKKL